MATTSSSRASRSRSRTTAPHSTAPETRRSPTPAPRPSSTQALSDQALGEAQAISDVVVTPVPITYQGEAASYAADAARALTPISPGEVSTTVTVQVRFTIAAADEPAGDGGDAS